MPAFRLGARLPHFLVDDESSLDVVAKVARSHIHQGGRPKLTLFLFASFETFESLPADLSRVADVVRVAKKIHQSDLAAVLVRPDGYIAAVYETSAALAEEGNGLGVFGERIKT